MRNTQYPIIFGLVVIIGSGLYLASSRFDFDDFNKNWLFPLSENKKSEFNKPARNPIIENKYSEVVQVTSDIKWEFDQSEGEEMPVSLVIIGYDETEKEVFRYIKNPITLRWCRVKALAGNNLYVTVDEGYMDPSYVYWQLDLQTNQIALLEEAEYAHLIKDSKIRFDDNGKKKGWRAKNKQANKTPSSDQTLTLDEYIRSRSFNLGTGIVTFRNVDDQSGSILINGGLDGILEGQYYIIGERIIIEKLIAVSGISDPSRNHYTSGVLFQNSDGELVGKIGDGYNKRSITLTPRR